jgi:hypothetical protein
MNKLKMSFKFYLCGSEKLKKNFIGALVVNFIEILKIVDEKHWLERH